MARTIDNIIYIRDRQRRGCPVLAHPSWNLLKGLLYLVDNWEGRMDKCLIRTGMKAEKVMISYKTTRYSYLVRAAA